MAYWYRICPVCDEGRLFVEVREEDKKIFLSCEECYTSWEKPEDVGNSAKEFFGIDILSHHADEKELREAGWRDMHETLVQTAVAGKRND